MNFIVAPALVHAEHRVVYVVGQLIYHVLFLLLHPPRECSLTPVALYVEDEFFGVHLPKAHTSGLRPQCEHVFTLLVGINVAECFPNTVDAN